jgi:hypothetical protein
MAGIVDLGAESAWVADRTGACLAIADREPITSATTQLARIGTTEMLRKSLTDVEVTVALDRPLLDVAGLAVFLLAVDDVLVPHRRYALESQSERQWRRR